MAFLVSSVAAGGPASAGIVGGIDFGAAGALTQLGSGTSAATFTNAQGNAATGYGLISVVNGDSTYCADGTANCALYYVINRTVSAAFGGGSDLYHNGTQFNLYYAPTAAINLLGQDSAANPAYIHRPDTVGDTAP